MTNIVTAAFETGSTSAIANALYQWDYGQVLRLEGVDLPGTYEVHFANQPGGLSKTALGNADGVPILDEYLTTGKPVYAWVYVHTGDSDGETVYMVTIPVIPRARPTDQPATPQQQTAISQALALLNGAIDGAQESAAAAAESAQSAAGSASSASASAIQANRSATQASSAAAGAASSASIAGQQASISTSKAEAAAASATAAADSVSAAAQTLADVRAEGAAQVSAITAEGQRVLASIPEDYTDLSDRVSDLRSAFAYSDLYNVRDFDGTLCENTNEPVEQGAFSSTNPDVASDINLRTVNYITGETYLFNPNQRLAYAIMEFRADGTYVRYIQGTVPSRSTNFYRDELLYLPAPSTVGGKYRVRITYDVAGGKNITPLDNTIAFYKVVPEKPEKYGYSRNYTDITGFLTFQRKSIGASSGITDSTTRLIAKLPNVGNVEVRMNTPNCRFAVFREDTSGATPTYTAITPGPWTWFYYRYTGDPSYNYYVLTRLETESTIDVDYGGRNVKVYAYDDEGIRNTGVNLWYGKTVAVFGDSIVQGRFRKNGADSTNALMPKPFPVLISETCNTDPGDYGIGGATVYGSGWNTLYTRRQAVSGYDIACICAGTNDFGQNVSESNFKSALGTVITALKTNNTVVYLLTPVTRATDDANTGGYHLSDYAGWAKEVATAKGIKVIDLYTLTASDSVFKANLPDSIHPNEAGQKMIADLVLRNIPV